MLLKHIVTYLFHDSETSPHMESTIRTLHNTLSQKKSREKIFDEKFF